MLPHYSPFKVAETLQPARRPVPGPHRPRHRARVGHRPDDDVRAPARPPRRPRPTTSRSSSPSCSPTTTARFPADHPFARLGRTLPGGAEQPRDLAARLVRRRARSGPAQLGLPVRVRRLHQPRRRARSPQHYRERLRAVAAARAPRVAVAVWAICADTDEEARAARRQRAHDVHAAAPGPADPGAAAREGAALPRRQQDEPCSRPRRRRLAGDRARRDRGGRVALRRRGGDRGHDHLRPRAPAGGPTS